MKVIEAVPHYTESDSFQIRIALRNLRQAVLVRKWVIVAVTVLTTALVSAYMWIWPPTFEAEVVIAADSEKDAQRINFYNGWSVFRREALNDEAAMLTSTPVLKAVAEKLHLRYDDVYHPFMSYLTHMWGESWLGKNYRKVKKWLFPPASNPYAPTAEEVEKYQLLSDFEKGVKVEQVKDASMGILNVKASNQRAAEIANAITREYLEQRIDRAVNEATNALAALTVERDKAQREMDQLESEMRDFRSKAGMMLTFEKDRLQLTQYETLRAAIAELKAQIADNENALKVVDSQLGGEARLLATDRQFKDAATQDRLTKLEANLAQTKQLFQPNSPEVRELEEQVRIASAELESHRDVPRLQLRVGDSYEVLRSKKNALESTLAGARAALQTKQGELDRMSATVNTLPEKMRVNADFERRQNMLELKLRALSEKASIATVSLATARSAPAALRVIEWASPPDQPTWPKTKLFLLAAIASGLLLGVLLALLLESIFTRVNRHRLWEDEERYDLFAVVQQDAAFVRSLFGPAPAARLAAPAAS
ncbi:MAG TPA: Wzz/FepE/Etk N-terminal domain-containing protein [Usitatibacter sp.]|nr:Wzz/FepE/Etk N-terminal domain-containing protein [Usitatibacter sp.]